eukprot:766395-Hanusia_phi.AAC.5
MSGRRNAVCRSSRGAHSGGSLDLEQVRGEMHNAGAGAAARSVDRSSRMTRAKSVSKATVMDVAGFLCCSSSTWCIIHVKFPGHSAAEALIDQVNTNTSNHQTLPVWKTQQAAKIPSTR